MKQILVAFLAVGALTGGASAAAPSADQKAEFYKTCMRIAENDTLCTCKADAALELIDADFMAVVISAMKGKAPAETYTVPYDAYISRSNAICIPGY